MANLLTRDDFGFLLPITTRWMDNDVYGHVNNVTYYSYFDTIANSYLIEQAELDIHNGDTIGFVVNSQCNYHSAIAFPDQLEGGLRVNRIGNSSVEYGIGIFKRGENEVVADGTFTHVFVKRESQRPAPIPTVLRAALEKILC
ncbi:MAG: thioesterase [Cellvibrionaceae bacterium]|nr:thioesterase [Cellvibrionaceae bacterium]